MVRGKTANTVIVGEGPPHDGDYEGTAGHGAIYVDADTPALYVNRSRENTTDWEPAGGSGDLDARVTALEDAGGGGPIEYITEVLAFDTPNLVIPSDGITGVDQVAKTFTVAGNRTARYVAGPCGVRVSTGNDDTYTVVSATFDTDHTDVVVSEAIPDATVDGNLSLTGPVGVLVATFQPGDVLGFAANNNVGPDWLDVFEAWDGDGSPSLSLADDEHHTLPAAPLAVGSYDLTAINVDASDYYNSHFAAGRTSTPPGFNPIFVASPMPIRFEQETSLYAYVSDFITDNDPSSTQGSALLHLVILRAAS